MFYDSYCRTVEFRPTYLVATTPSFRQGLPESSRQGWQPTKNIRFSEAVACAEAFGFRLDRINGSHHIFVHQDIPELLNLQNIKGKAKPYQIKQLLQLIETHNLPMEKE